MKRELKVGYAFVVADLFHIGLLHLLQTAEQSCDFLIVGVLTDEAAASYKRQPVIPFNQRVSVIRSLKCVDMVVTQDTKDPTETLKRLISDGWEVKLLIHGDDWPEIPGSEYMKSVGGRVLRAPYYQGQSTTKIIEAIKRLNP